MTIERFVRGDAVATPGALQDLASDHVRLSLM
jgi:hypothetical protein